MISIIISSVNKNQLRLVSENIRKTVGVPFELLSFDNHEGKYGICEIYNRGIAKAKYDILCFMHEDIVIQTRNWGRIVSEYFKNHENLGLVGVAGKTTKSSVASSWDTPYGTSYVNLIQHFKYVDKSPRKIIEPAERDQDLNPVAWVDGVWLCAPKRAAQECMYDENLQGFHGYDIDFSLKIGQRHSVAVSHEILIEHFSEGNFSIDWLDSMLYIQGKWKDRLPIHLDASEYDLEKHEKLAFRYLIKKYREEFKISFLTGLKILNASSIRNCGLGLYLKMCFSLVRILIIDKPR